MHCFRPAAWALPVPLFLAAVASGLPQARLVPRIDGSMRLVASNDANHACDGEIAPRGVSLAVKGPPWLPLTDHFERETSLSSYDLEQLASAGVNMIRLGAMMPGVLPNPPVNGVYEHDQAYVQKLVDLVNRAAAYGMYTLVTFHQDVISQYYCGEGLPRWAADEVHEAFPAQFEDEVLELLHRLSLDIPGLDHLEDQALRNFIRGNVHKAHFPMPVAEPFEVHAGGDTVYPKWQCDKFQWYQYQLTFAAGSAYRRLFDLESSTFKHVETYWKILATAFKGNPNVLAFDLFNEPHPGSLLTEPWMMSAENADRRLAPFYGKIAEAIHEIDPDRLVTFSPVTWEEGGYYIQEMNGPANQMCAWLRTIFNSVPLMGCETFWDVARWMPASGLETTAFTSVPLPGQSILSFHFYTPPELNHEAYARKRMEDAKRLQVYPLLSETCCLFDHDALQRLYWFEKAQIGWTMWEYKNMADGNGFGAWITGTGPSMFHEDGTPIKEYWRRLAHPSAQLVRGEVQANIFDFTVGTFNLTFQPSADCDLAGPDAIIVWPWTWWSYINITSIPKIEVSPPGAAVVQEFAGSAEGFSTPVVRFAVEVLQRERAITVTLSFVNFKNIDLVPEEPEPSVFGPWYQGLGWLLLCILVSYILLHLCSCCCQRCCCCCCVRRGTSDQQDLVKEDQLLLDLHGEDQSSERCLSFHLLTKTPSTQGHLGYILAPDTAGTPQSSGDSLGAEPEPEMEMGALDTDLMGMEDFGGSHSSQRRDVRKMSTVQGRSGKRRHHDDDLFPEAAGGAGSSSCCGGGRRDKVAAAGPASASQQPEIAGASTDLLEMLLNADPCSAEGDAGL